MDYREMSVKCLAQRKFSINAGPLLLGPLRERPSWGQDTEPFRLVPTGRCPSSLPMASASQFPGGMAQQPGQQLGAQAWEGRGGCSNLSTR